ncbi:CBS domain-containing protein [Natronobacterium gregoryi]|uniref:CBS domain-containing protein n=2 Tax=Natronobacterium gregoryi TaxID=44930 RepID=L0AGM8_NATGS|nr:CBS domain-containing protein [Natronobacterium gregoryi]AFZ72307.1 putative signal-transduction protein containing cAMP-binding and CBS domains [Natronobacterium gregoryi SP2]ELY62418.1 signal-transduction protein containing camp-binding and cbs domains [Natronobacterium gregoryi SP2]PLK18482.1 CBS domain-containing protein [Natronobacterium gregoryi SP2]SFJ70074.1 CBS domain-containing protein [Natronobacterium gregoryi]
MLVKQIMSTPAVTIGPSATLREAVGTMLEEQIGSIVVVDPGMVGIVTRSDILRTQHQTGLSLEELRVQDAMTSEDVVKVSPTNGVDEAAEAMTEHEVKRLPVFEGIDLVGVVTMNDVARCLPDRVDEIRRTLKRKNKDGW